MRVRSSCHHILSFVIVLCIQSCSLFDPRDPEQPGQTSLDNAPATVPSIVISNLKNSVAQKNVDNYIRNFTDPAVSGKPFIFIPSADASSIYPNLRDWTYANEKAYFQNLVAKQDGFSTLELIPKDSLLGATESSYNFDYVFTFQHTDAFSETAKGTLQFVLTPDASNIWSIYQWSDFSTSTTDITWSAFKGKFGN